MAGSIKGDKKVIADFICDNTEKDAERRKALFRKLIAALKKAKSETFSCVQVNPYHFLVQAGDSDKVIDIQTARWQTMRKKPTLYAKAESVSWTKG